MLSKIIRLLINIEVAIALKSFRRELTSEDLIVVWPIAVKWAYRLQRWGIK